MPQLKLKHEPAETPFEAFPPAQDTSNLSLVTPASDLQAIHSPAIGLRATLEQALEQGWDIEETPDTIAVRKVPIGWTLVGMSAICAVFWYTVASLIF